MTCTRMEKVVLSKTSTFSLRRMQLGWPTQLQPHLGPVRSAMLMESPIKLFKHFFWGRRWRRRRHGAFPVSLHGASVGPGAPCHPLTRLCVKHQGIE